MSFLAIFNHGQVALLVVDATVVIAKANRFLGVDFDLMFQVVFLLKELF
jgi:hypothetical protein